MDIGRFLNILRSMLYFVRDIAFVIFYVRTIDANRNMTWQRRLGACFFLLVIAVNLLVGTSQDKLGTAVIVMSNVPEFALSIFRFLNRFWCCFAYIYILKHISIITAVYDAMLINTACMVSHNLFLTPVTRPILNATVMWSCNPIVNNILCLTVVNAVSVLVYYLVYRFIPLRDIKNVNRSRMALLIFLTIESQYLNSSLKLMGYAVPGQAIQFSIYTVLLQILLSIALGYIERYQKTSLDYMRSQLENQAAHSLLKSIEQQKQNDEITRHIRHDLRNHLITLRYLIKSGKDEESLQYIDSLRNEYVSFQPRIHTGNITLDGILIQKMDYADKVGTAFSVSSDFSYLDPMNSADMCILFGNLLDNALEACQKVDTSSRYINIRGSRMGESILYSIENSCAQNVEVDGSPPKTTKPDRQDHGIGLVSVTRVVKKYDGTIAFSCKDGCFSVVCAFPLPLNKVSGI